MYRTSFPSQAAKAPRAFARPVERRTPEAPKRAVQYLLQITWNYRKKNHYHLNQPFEMLLLLGEACKGLAGAIGGVWCVGGAGGGRVGRFGRSEQFEVVGAAFSMSSGLGLIRIPAIHSG